VDNRYNLNHISYDKNGNIKNLLRNGFVNDSSVITDNLTYNYAANSNVLEGVSDASNQVAGFNDGSTSGNDYTYDANGNMKTDANKQITSISYNHLNLPAEVGFENSNTKKITYSYDATGVKLKKVVTDGSTITTTDYAGNYTYKNGGLEFFNHVEGYVEPTENISRPFQYVYQFKDHLGNIRLSYSDDDNDGHVDVYRPGTIMSSPIDVDGDGDYKNEIREESNYYPFGLKHKGYNNVITGRDHKYGFGGKEYNDELGLDWYDVSARNYDPALGRWMNLDPLAEMMRRHSPYSFGFDNPIRFIDPDGMKPEDVIITGKKANKAFKELRKSVSSDLKLSKDKSGNVTYERKSSGVLSTGSQALIDAIDDSSAVVNIVAENTALTSDGSEYVGGAMMGSNYESNTGVATSTQEINPKVLSKMSNFNNKKGADTLHEVIEGHESAKFSKNNQRSFGSSATPLGKFAYDSAHPSASLAAPQTSNGVSTSFKDSSGNPTINLMRGGSGIYSISKTTPNGSVKTKVVQKIKL